MSAAIVDWLSSNSSVTMVFFLPAMVLGGLGTSHHYATKELENISKASNRHRVGFFWGAAFGLTIGVWLGANFSKAFLRLFSMTDWLLGSDSSLKPPDEQTDTSPSQQQPS